MKLKAALWGVVALVVGVFALTSIDWDAVSGEGSRGLPGNTRSGKPRYVMAKVASEDHVVIAVGAVHDGSDAIGGLQRVSLSSGWDYSDGWWRKQFGPYREDDAFVLTALSEDKLTDVTMRCALQTVGRPQIPWPPQQVVRSDGKATCSIVIGQ